MKFFVPSEQKLVLFLQGKLGPISGKGIRRILEANLCRINGRIERFGSRTVQENDSIELASHWKSLLTSKIEPFETIYDDEFLKVVNKPAGWVCIDAETLKTFGKNHFLVHRLDKDTTGLLMIAKSQMARDELMGLFERREIQKEYLALVDGAPKETQGSKKTFLSKKGSFEGQTIWGSNSHGLMAITHWEKRAVGKSASLLLCQPETGRTHQIRVHMAEMGHPILIDRQYAKQFKCQLFFQRPLLHAYTLKFSFKGKIFALKAPLPCDFREALKQTIPDAKDFCHYLD